MRRTLGLIAILSAVAFNAIAEPSFDCTKAQTASEKLICANDDLQWSDRQLARLYALARKETPEAQRASLIESHGAFWRHATLARPMC